MIDVQGPRCETCKFFFVDGDTTMCRRFPPIPLALVATMKSISPEYRIHAQFPLMLPSGWCGEHQPIS